MAKVTKARHRSALRILNSVERTTAMLGLDGKKPHPPRWNKDLMCHLDDWVKYPDTKEVSLIVGRGENTDMSGAIKVATVLMPEVESIGVFDDQRVHTFYERTGDTWKAFPIAVGQRWRIFKSSLQEFHVRVRQSSLLSHCDTLHRKD